MSESLGKLSNEAPCVDAMALRMCGLDPPQQKAFQDPNPRPQHEFSTANLGSGQWRWIGGARSSLGACVNNCKIVLRMFPGASMGATDSNGAPRACVGAPFPHVPALAPPMLRNVCG